MQSLGVTDDRFSWENFGDQPDYLIFQVLAFYTRRHQEAVNQQAQIHAIGWSGFFNSFGSKDGSKIEAWQMLPFPHLAKEQQQRISDKTARLLAGLVQAGRLPNRVKVLVQQFEEVGAILSDLDTE